MATRREFLASPLTVAYTRPDPDRFKPIIISVNVLFDQAAHAGKGLTQHERQLFQLQQERARVEFAVSGIRFDLKVTEGAYLRHLGWAAIAWKFLVPKAINLFVTESLSYDLDRDRTGGSSMGPYKRGPSYAGNQFYQTFLGLREASGNTLVHEYAHHFTLDTAGNSGSAGNFWADLRNDYWLWRQRHGTPIRQFRAVSKAEFARFEGG